MFNIALGWSFLIFALTAPGGKLLAAVFAVPALRTIPPYQGVLTNVFANYWLPALLIYIVLIATRAERYLKPNTGIHVLFGLANTVLCLYATLRVLTATVQGGGAAFALASISTPFTLAALSLLVIATIWLALRSVMRWTKPVGPDAQTETSRSRAVSMMVASAALLPPFAFFGWVYLSNAEQIGKVTAEHHAKTTRLDALCNAVRIDIRRRTLRAKSMLFPQSTNATIPMLQDLDFIEIKQGSWTTTSGEPYVRLLKKPNEPIFINGNLNVVRQDVEQSESEYEVSTKPIASEADRLMGLIMEETTVLDRRTNEVLAVFTLAFEFQSVVTKNSRFCPNGFEYAAYQREVPSYVLGLMDEKASKKFEERLAALKGQVSRSTK